MANTYALLSDDGAALLIDYGYDFTTGLPDGTDRSSRRPWLETIPALKRDFGIDRVEVAIPTHYHDDHVAGFNLLRDVEGTQVWAPSNMTAQLEEPTRFDLPCLWYDPIPVDRELSFSRPFRWHEYEIAVHELPGHTLYAAAIEFEVDGRRVVATGDQQDGRWVAGERPEFLNYQYRNGFQFDDFVRSAELYRADPARPPDQRPLASPPRHRRIPRRTPSGRHRAGAAPPRAAATRRGRLRGGRVRGRGSNHIAPRSGRATTSRSVCTFGTRSGVDAEASIRLAVPAGWTAEPAEIAVEPRAARRGTDGVRGAADDAGAGSSRADRPRT